MSEQKFNIDGAVLNMVDRQSDIDAVLREMVGDATNLEDVRPTLDQLEYFAGMGWDTGLEFHKVQREATQLRRELIRMMRVNAFQAQAGTSEDRAALAAEVERSAAALQKRGPEIREKLEKLQNELTSLEKAASSSAKQLEQAQVALDGLRDCAPPAIAATADRRRRMIQVSLGATIAELQGRKTAIEAILKLDGRQLVDHLTLQPGRSPLRAALQPGGSVVWDQHCEELRAELADIDSKLPALLERRASEDAAANAMLDFYAR